MAAREIVRVPYAPRPFFEPLHERAERWGIVVAHRRAGKTVACINELIRAAACCPLGRPEFAYIAPQLNQAKDIAWRHLLHYTECFGDRRRTNISELWVELPDNGARIRLYGADNPDRLRGLHLDGVVFDEFGDMNPETWTLVIRPLLTDREGWAIFIGTPKGRNGFQQIWAAAETDPDWFRLMLKASETRLLGDKELADAKRAMSGEEYAQEFECNFDAAVRGAYWAREIAALEEAGRIGDVPHDPGLRVDTAWDLGMADSTVIWFIQKVPGAGEIRVIDVLKGEGVGLQWYVRRLEERNWVWGDHYFPHDVMVRELGSGRSRFEVLSEYGVHATACSLLPVEDGIQAVRTMMPKCWFDRENCQEGLEALRMYRRVFDPRRQEYQPRPHHDWTSHYADAFRYYATGHREKVIMKPWTRHNRWVV